MPVPVKVICKYCRKDIYRESGRIRENIKLGHNFYCSKECEAAARTLKRKLICDNPECKKEFSRQLNDILANNYCSRSCAAHINNQKFPKRGVEFKICANTVCGSPFKGRDKYCSVACYSTMRRHYTPAELLGMLQSAAHKLGRTPTRRELHLIDKPCIEHFGSWNGAVTAAGLVPNRSHSQRMYKRMRANAWDGHICDSISEVIIDNWFTEHDIPHQRDIRYPGTNHLADWGLPGNIFIEYFGLVKDSPRYDRVVWKKKDLCRKHGIELIEIYPQDLYPKVILGKKFKNFISLSIS